MLFVVALLCMPPAKSTKEKVMLEVNTHFCLHVISKKWRNVNYFAHHGAKITFRKKESGKEVENRFMYIGLWLLCQPLEGKQHLRCYNIAALQLCVFLCNDVAVMIIYTDQNTNIVLKIKRDSRPSHSGFSTKQM